QAQAQAQAPAQAPAQALPTRQDIVAAFLNTPTLQTDTEGNPQIKIQTNNRKKTFCITQSGLMHYWDSQAKSWEKFPNSGNQLKATKKEMEDLRKKDPTFWQKIPATTRIQSVARGYLARKKQQKPESKTKTEAGTGTKPAPAAPPAAEKIPEPETKVETRTGTKPEPVTNNTDTRSSFAPKLNFAANFSLLSSIPTALTAFILTYLSGRKAAITRGSETPHKSALKHSVKNTFDPRKNKVIIAAYALFGAGLFCKLSSYLIE
ncbi:IQ calmodulin-binding motif-containing protein, partial [Candidatus Babeliales bacterium]|nr:IQ calmodulin-binding motif-containing protein [Candidatus Babeliales bacterium]